MNGRAGDAQGDINRPAMRPTNRPADRASDRPSNPGEPVSLHALPIRFARSLTIHIEDHPAPGHDATSDATSDPASDDASGATTDDAWDRLCAQNPKLFDGPILALTRLAVDEGTIWCVRESYRRLALRDVCNFDVTILSVTVVLEASDGHGRPHFLLGKRGLRTRSYPGLWELGPAGGLDVPPVGVATLGHTDLLAQANAELREEVGIREPVRTARAIALVVDRLAGSCDIVLHARLDTPIERLGCAQPDEPWEYARTRWLAMDEIRAFLAARGDRIIGPTRLLLRWLSDNAG